MKLANYNSTQKGFAGLANILIRFRMGGHISHNEVVFEPGDGVDHLMPDGTTQPDENGAVWCASSTASDIMPEWSIRRPGGHGGVRFKRIVIDDGKWDILPYKKDPVKAAEYFKANEGRAYDWRLIFGFIVWLIPNKKSKIVCSEGCAAAGQYEMPHLFHPHLLYIVVKND